MQETDTIFSCFNALLLDLCTLLSAPIQRPLSFDSTLGHRYQPGSLEEHPRPEENEMQENE
jgi:hypothetical protein